MTAASVLMGGIQAVYKVAPELPGMSREEASMAELKLTVATLVRNSWLCDL